MTSPIPTTGSVVRGRRLSVAVLASAALVLTACGGGNGDSDGDGDGQAAEARSLTDEMEQVFDINEQPRDAMQDGGELTLPVGGVSPQFNQFTNAGNNADTRQILSAIDNAGAWTSTADGEALLDENYVLSAEEELTDDGVQKIHYELNPDAVWNDGTPIDWETYKHTVDIRSGEDPDYDLVSTTGYELIESVERGEDEWHFTITMKEPFYPWQTHFAKGTTGSGVLIHPEVDTPEKFNEGFVNKVNAEYRAGPFALDVYDQGANTVTLVPNENWWGEAPMLDRLSFVAYESSATITAFQNRQIDAVGIATEPRYEELTSWGTEDEDYDIRRGQRLSACGFVLNTEATNLEDVAVREAIFTALDREQLAAIQFEGINWDEENPGSWMMLPFDDRYQDNYPVDDNDPERAGEVLEEAGWTRDDGEDYYSKDGEELTVQLNSFGDDPINQAMIQATQSMAAEAGINLDIHNRGSGDFGEAVGSGDFGMVNMCYSVGSDPTTTPAQFFSTGEGNLTNAGSEELDEQIDEITSIQDDDERIQTAMDVEKQALSEYFHYLSYANGPTISAYSPGLANIGPSLFETTDWTVVGWEDDSEGGAEDGVDVDELEDTEGEDLDEEDAEGSEDEETEEDDDE